MRLVKAFIVLVALLYSPVAIAEVEGSELARPVPEDQWTPEVRLWLARSVLGEVGWCRPDEYTAVAWVYVTRTRQTKRYSLLRMIRTYSAAVKNRRNRRNPWLYELGSDVIRPATWPVGPRWKGLHDEAWRETLEWADEWYAGKRPNTCPGANHYGGWVDRHRAEAKRWSRVKCHVKTRNRFYTSLKLVPKCRTYHYRW